MASQNKHQAIRRGFKRIPQVAVLMETSRSFGRGVIRGIANYARVHGPWNLQVQPGDIELKFTLREGWPLDAVIGRIEHQSILAIIKRRKLPAVSLIVKFRNYPLPLITSPTQICQTAFEHLRDCGHQRFAYYDRKNSWGIARGRSFSEIASAAGFKVYRLQSSAKHDASLNETATWLRRLPKPIGLLAGDDLAGREIIDICRYAGVAVPEEVAVLGIDNDDLFCEISYPTLSSVTQNAERVGYEGAAMLHQLMLGKHTPYTTMEIEPLGVKMRQSTDTLAIDDPLVADAARFIREHAREGIDVGDLLKHTLVSRRSLEARFKKVLGRTPHEEIFRTRLAHAKQFLLDTDLKVSGIARKAGFSSNEYLHRAFRRCCGMTPTQFRTRNRRTGR